MVKEKNELKQQYIKNTLNLYHLIKNTDDKLGLVFYTDVSFFERFLFNRINKKTTVLYFSFFDLFKVFELTPKHPNFCFSFNSLSQITKTIRLNALFIKFKGIYCFSQSIDSSFLEYSLLSHFFIYILKSNIWLIFFNVLKMINLKIYEFN